MTAMVCEQLDFFAAQNAGATDQREPRIGGRRYAHAGNRDARLAGLARSANPR